MKIKQLFQQTLGVFTKQWRLIAFLMFVGYLPLNLYLEFSPMAQIDVNDMQAVIKIAQISGFYELLIGSFATILIILMTKQVLNGEKTSFKELWSKKLNVVIYGKYVWTTLIKNLLIGLLLFLLIVPGILFAVYWLFAEQVAVLEGEGGIKGLMNAQAIVKGNWWHFFAVALMGFLIPMLGGTFIVILQVFIVQHWATNLVATFFADLLQAFFIIYLTVAYLKLKK